MLNSCPVCGSSDIEKDDKIHGNSVIVVCNACGFSTHDYDEKKEEEILEFYRNEHRKEVVGKQKPDAYNIITTNNKKAFIAKFLSDFLKGKKGLVVGDVGAATGYLVHWFRTLGHKATGSEYALEYRRMSENYYGVPLTEELENRKYDLITIYHVLEHMMRPDLKLKKYRDMLKDDGHIMISVPEYFNLLDEGVGTNVLIPNASPQYMFENYFHKDHINIFSKQSIKNLIYQCGFEIVKEDYLAYGQTYLCKKTENKYNIVKEDSKEIKRKILAAKKAIECACADDFKGAIAAYPDFPEAHLGMAMKIYQKDPERQRDYYNEVEAKYPEVAQAARYLSTKGIWLYQNQHYAEAVETLEKSVNIRPIGDVFMFIAWCLIELGKNQEAIKALNFCMMLNPGKWQEAVNFQIHAACNMPTWDEVAMEQLKSEFAKQNKGAIQGMKPKDPVMDGA